jgi:hypothetical protein
VNNGVWSESQRDYHIYEWKLKSNKEEPKGEDNTNTKIRYSHIYRYNMQMDTICEILISSMYKYRLLSMYNHLDQF